MKIDAEFGDLHVIPQVEVPGVSIQISRPTAANITTGRVYPPATVVAES